MSKSPAMSENPARLPEDDDPTGPPVVLIAGPTASGKSAVALCLAERMNGVIINADASQVYADLAILSARPEAADLARAPHRLFGHVDGLEACSAARWAREARTEIAEVRSAGQMPILVGGTGLYLDTLLYGIAPVPDIEPAIRQVVRALPVAAAYGALSTEDPEAATRLNPADTARIARALEVVRSTGKPLGHWQRERHGGIAGNTPIRAGLVMRPREDLADRAARRLTNMLTDGAIEEVAALLERQLPADRPVLRALGVREIGQYLAEEISREVAEALILKATLAYQKRQLTWGRNRQRDWTRLAPDAIAAPDAMTKL